MDGRPAPPVARRSGCLAEIWRSQGREFVKFGTTIKRWWNFEDRKHHNSIGHLYLHILVDLLMTRCWFGIIFWNFTPKNGEDFQFDEHVFQMGWNHQPEEQELFDWFVNTYSVLNAASLIIHTYNYTFITYRTRNEVLGGGWLAINVISMIKHDLGLGFCVSYRCFLVTQRRPLTSFFATLYKLWYSHAAHGCRCRRWRRPTRCF